MDELQRYTMYDDHMTRGIDALPTKYGQWVKYEDAVRIVQQRNDLLARIHGDGGQYIDAHGLDKAIEDAHTEVGRLHAENDRLRDALKEGEQPVSRPRVVCLCGSTRFYKEFQRANYELTMSGEIVLSVGFFWHASQEAHGETWGCTPEQKVALDVLHFRKIDLADYVFVLNVGGYIGHSTGREIDYALSIGKPVEYLEPPKYEGK